jgi:hypothetical protein
MLKEILVRRRSVFCVAIRLYGLDGPGFESRQGKYFLFSRTSWRVLGFTQSAVQCLPVVKRPGRGVDDSPPSTAKVQNWWSYISAPHMLSRCGQGKVFPYLQPCWCINVLNIEIAFIISVWDSLLSAPPDSYVWFLSSRKYFRLFRSYPWQQVHVNSSKKVNINTSYSLHLSFSWGTSNFWFVLRM